MMPRQITFRAEPEIADEWTRFVKDSLILQRYHLICALLLYMWSGTERRTATQSAYARFRREGQLLRPTGLDERAGGFSERDLQLLAAYRGASGQARQEALTVLQRGAKPAATETDEPVVDSIHADGSEP